MKPITSFLISFGFFLILSTSSAQTTTELCNLSQLPSELQNGLVGFWPFCSNSNDISGNNNDGTVYGASLGSDSFGNSNSTYEFNVNSSAGWGSAQDQIIVPYNSSMNSSSLTLSAWVFPREKPVPYSNRPLSIFGRWDGGLSNEVFRFQVLDDNSLYFQNSTDSFQAGNVPYDSWSFVTLTLDNNNLKLFVNAELVGEHNMSGSINLAGDSDLSIGSTPMINGTWYFFDGFLDQMGYWNRALSTTEIQGLYQLDLTTPAPTGQPIQLVCPGSQIQSSDINISYENGASINWYDSQSSTTPLSSSTFLPVGDNTYFISQTINGVESTDRFEIRLLMPDLFLSYDSDICPGTTTTITFNNDVGSVPGAVQNFTWSTSNASAEISVTPNPNQLFPSSYFLSFTYDSELSGVPPLTCALTASIYSRDSQLPTFNTTPADTTIECDASTLPADTNGPATASDNCDGDVTVTYADTTVAGVGNNSVITRVWTATDDNNNVTTYTQTITVADTTAPIADDTELDDVTAECSIDLITAPTATDNCSGIITGTTNTTFPIDAQGVTVVTWTFEDANGNISNQIQNVVIDDITPPIIDETNLDDIISQCIVETLTAPTATDNCAGTIIGTTSTVFPITNEGLTEVIWTYSDFEGNIITQKQNIIIDYSNPVDLNELYTICNESQSGGDSIVINPNLSAVNYDFIWLDDLGNILSQDSTYEVFQGGTYILEVYPTGCPVIIDTFTVEEIYPPNVTVDIISEDFSENNIIVISPDNNGNYEYNLDGNQWQQDNTFTNVSGGIHEIEVRDIRGCGITTYNIYIIDYPRFFTPNGDGYNDYWNIEALSIQPESKIYIFDRYGKLIKQIRPSGLGWDGIYNGQIMPTNDYWFYLEYNDLVTGEPKQFRSHFTLKR